MHLVPFLTTCDSNPELSSVSPETFKIWEDNVHEVALLYRQGESCQDIRIVHLCYCTVIVILWVPNGGREYVMKITLITSNLISLSICTCLTSHCNWQLLPIKERMPLPLPSTFFTLGLLCCFLHHYTTPQYVCPIQKRMIWIPPAKKGFQKTVLCNKQSHLFEWIASYSKPIT